MTTTDGNQRCCLTLFMFLTVDQWVLSLQNTQLNGNYVKTSGILTDFTVYNEYTNGSFDQMNMQYQLCVHV